MVDQITLGSGYPLTTGGGALQASTPRPGPATGSSAGSPAAPRSQASIPVAGPGAQDAALAQVNQHLQQSQSDLKLQLDSGSGRTVFQVVQQGTGQVLFQVPSAEILGMSRRVREMQSQVGGSGALVDKEG